MSEHEMCCGTTCDKQAVAAEIEQLRKERDEALAYGERQNKALIDATDWNWISAREKAEDDGVDFFEFHVMQRIYEVSQEKPPVTKEAE